MSGVVQENWTRERLQAELDACPAIAFMRISVESIDVDAARVVLRLPMRDELERAKGSRQFHGGPIASLIDTAGDYAVALVVGGGVPTINFRVDYLRPAAGDFLLAKAEVRRAGRTIAVADVAVEDAEGRLCAAGRGSYLAAVG